MKTVAYLQDEAVHQDLDEHQLQELFDKGAIYECDEHESELPVYHWAIGYSWNDFDSLVGNFVFTAVFWAPYEKDRQYVTELMADTSDEAVREASEAFGNLLAQVRSEDTSTGKVKQVYFGYGADNEA